MPSNGGTPEPKPGGGAKPRALEAALSFWPPEILSRNAHEQQCLIPHLMQCVIPPEMVVHLRATSKHVRGLLEKQKCPSAVTVSAARAFGTAHWETARNGLQWMALYTDVCKLKVDCKLSNADLVNVLNVFQECRGLFCIEISDCSLQYRRVTQAVASMIAMQRRLLVVDFWKSDFGDSLPRLVGAISDKGVTTPVTSLCLADAGLLLKTQGIGSMMKPFRNCFGNLRCLDFDGNRNIIMHCSTGGLCSMLKELQKLEMLNLSRCSVGHSKGTALLNELSGKSGDGQPATPPCPALRWLLMQGNPIHFSNMFLNALEEILKNMGAVVVDLSVCEFKNRQGYVKLQELNATYSSSARGKNEGRMTTGQHDDPSECMLLHVGLTVSEKDQWTSFRRSFDDESGKLKTAVILSIPVVSFFEEHGDGTQITSFVVMPGTTFAEVRSAYLQLRKMPAHSVSFYAMGTAPAVGLRGPEGIGDSLPTRFVRMPKSYLGQDEEKCVGLDATPAEVVMNGLMISNFPCSTMSRLMGSYDQVLAMRVSVVRQCVR